MRRCMFQPSSANHVADRGQLQPRSSATDSTDVVGGSPNKRCCTGSAPRSESCAPTSPSVPIYSPHTGSARFAGDTADFVFECARLAGVLVHALPRGVAELIVSCGAMREITWNSV